LSLIAHNLFRVSSDGHCFGDVASLEYDRDWVNDTDLDGDAIADGTFEVWGFYSHGVFTGL
jgi:hypothetical protein